MAQPLDNVNNLIEAISNLMPEVNPIRHAAKLVQDAFDSIPDPSDVLLNRYGVTMALVYGKVLTPEEAEGPLGKACGYFANAKVISAAAYLPKFRTTQDAFWAAYKEKPSAPPQTPPETLPPSPPVAGGLNSLLG